MNIQKKILFVLLAAAALATGCQSPDVYYWGHYENLIYVSYAKPDKVSPELQARTMEEDMNKAISANEPQTPDFICARLSYPILGNLYYQMGKTDLTLQEFIKEKTQFPESTVFMDRMIANLSKK